MIFWCLEGGVKISILGTSHNAWKELLCSWLLTEVNLSPEEIEDGRKNAEGCAEIAPRKLDPLDNRPSLGIRWTPVMGRSKETGKRGERRSAPRPLWFSAEDSSSSSPNAVRLRMLFRVSSRKYAECTCGRRALGLDARRMSTGFVCVRRQNN